MYFCPCARANFNMPWSLSVLLWWPNHCWRLSPHRFKFTLVRFCLNYWQICGLDRENRNKVRAGRRINNGSNQNNLGLLSASLSLSLSLRGKTETHRSHAIDVRLTPAKARIPRKCGVFEGAMLAGKDWPESLAKGKAVSSPKLIQKPNLVFLCRQPGRLHENNNDPDLLPAHRWKAAANYRHS